MTDFDKRHGPGSMTLSASLWPTLVLPAEHRPAWLPSAYAYGAHLLGKAPLPPPEGNLARLGKYLEPAAYDLLEESGIEVIDRQRWFEHPTMRAGATLDGRVDEECNVEIKTISIRNDWNGRAPLYARVQSQCQMSCSGASRTLIVPLVRETCELGPIHEEVRRDDVIDALEEKGRQFLALLDKGELPAPDASRSTIQALVKTIQLDSDAVIDLSASDEAWMRLQRWRQSKLDQQAAKQLCEADENWFRVRMLSASAAKVGEFEVVAKDVNRKAYNVPAHTYRQYSIKEPK